MHNYQSPSRLERLTVIVRDLTCKCTDEEVQEAFTVDDISPKYVMRDMSDTWYIHFSCEKDATTALIASWGKTIRGVPIQARMKNQVIPQRYRQKQSNLRQMCGLKSEDLSYCLLELPSFRTQHHWHYGLIQERWWDERNCIRMRTFNETETFHVDTSSSISSKADSTDILKDISWQFSGSHDTPKQRYRARKHKRKRKATRLSRQYSEINQPSNLGCDIIEEKISTSIASKKTSISGSRSEVKMYLDIPSEMPCTRILFPVQAGSDAMYSDDTVLTEVSFQSVREESDSNDVDRTCINAFSEHFNVILSGVHS
jgi:hypothetical protein